VGQAQLPDRRCFAGDWRGERRYRQGNSVVIKGWSQLVEQVEAEFCRSAKVPLSSGAHDIPPVLIVGHQQRLQLPAENGFEITGRMFCAEAMFEGYMKRTSSLERLFLVHLIFGIRQR
jgi:hypothetical protein